MYVWRRKGGGDIGVRAHSDLGEAVIFLPEKITQCSNV